MSLSLSQTYLLEKKCWYRWRRTLPQKDIETLRQRIVGESERRRKCGDGKMPVLLQASAASLKAKMCSSSIALVTLTTTFLPAVNS